jgi:hypothetical protein
MAKFFLFNYPVETEEAFRFWNSDHKCNQAKAFVCFSTDEHNFHELMKRHGYQLQWRNRVWANYAPYISFPSMEQIPFSPLGPWWNCLASESSIDLEWIIREIEEDTIITEDGRPILTEASTNAAPSP